MTCYFTTPFNTEQYFHDHMTVHKVLNFDVLPPLVDDFLQFKICMRFPQQMYKDMVLLSTVAFVAIEQ